MWSSGFLLLSSSHRIVIISRGPDYFLSKFFKNLLEKFCPSVPWDSPVRPFWVIFAFLDFRVKLRFQGRFLTVRPGSRFSGHPTGKGSILITSCQTSPYKIDSSSIFDLRADFRVLGRFRPSGWNLRSSDRPRPSRG